MSSFQRGRGRGRGRRNRGGDWRDNQPRIGKSTKEGAPPVDESSSVIKAFRVFQEELDCRNDRHERIFKLSRDITIESKRIIFLLQRVIGSEDPEKLLSEAAEKIAEINSTKFVEIAKELDGQDSFQYLRAYTGGLQEYIEAVTFYHYLSDQHLVNLDKIQNQLIFANRSPDRPAATSAPEPVEGVLDLSKPDPQPDTDNPASKDNTVEDAKKDSVDDDSSKSCGSVSVTCGSEDKQISVHVPASEYMLGVADFTGELMRMAINSVGAGDLDTPNVVANMMRVIHNAFSVFDNASRELRKKASVLRQSLQKVETACYTLTVRGSEIPKHMLTDVFTSSADATVDNYNVDEVEELYD